MDAEDAWRGGLWVGGRLSGGKNGKIYDKVMNAARQISRRFCRATGERTRYYITVIVSMKSDPSRFQGKLGEQNGIR